MANNKNNKIIRWGIVILKRNYKRMEKNTLSYIYNRDGMRGASGKHPKTHISVSYFLIIYAVRFFEFSYYLQRTKLTQTPIKCQA
jgi:hypothetical protein